jgi:hypothetical protein
MTSRLHEPEFFIRKAIGWALREYAKHDPVWVSAPPPSPRSPPPVLPTNLFPILDKAGAAAVQACDVKCVALELGLYLPLLPSPRAHCRCGGLWQTTAMPSHH